MQDKGAVQLPHGSPDEAYPHGRKRLSDLDQVSPPVRNHGGGDPPVRRTQVILLFSPSPLQFYQLSCLVKWSRYPLFNDGSNALAVIMVSSSIIEIRCQSHFQSLNAENHPKSRFPPLQGSPCSTTTTAWSARSVAASASSSACRSSRSTTAGSPC